MSDAHDHPRTPLPLVQPPLAPPPLFEEGDTEEAPAIIVRHLVGAEVEPAPAEAASILPPLLVLVEVSGRYDGRGTLVTGATATIGRSGTTLTLALAHDAWVSKEHARLRYHDDAWWLEDGPSKNGTYHGGMRVTVPVALRPGQIIRVGHTEILLSDDPALATPQPHAV